MLATGSTTTAPDAAGAINAKASKKTMSSNLPSSLPPILPDEEALAKGADIYLDAHARGSGAMRPMRVEPFATRFRIMI
jgi:hypothetical protein